MCLYAFVCVCVFSFWFVPLMHSFVVTFAAAGSDFPAAGSDFPYLSMPKGIRKSKLLVAVIMAVLFDFAVKAGCESGDCTSGHGVFTLSDGRRYEGEWKRNKRHGLGVLTWPDGSRYEGVWKLGKPHGHGVHTRLDGTRHEGDYIEGKLNGYGVLRTTPDGKRYEGSWKEGMAHGCGVLTRPGSLWGTWRWEGHFREGDAPAGKNACEGCCVSAVEAALVAASAARAAKRRAGESAEAATAPMRKAAEKMHQERLASKERLRLALQEIGLERLVDVLQAGGIENTEDLVFLEPEDLQALPDIKRVQAQKLISYAKKMRRQLPDEL